MPGPSQSGLPGPHVPDWVQGHQPPMCIVAANRVSGEQMFILRATVLAPRPYQPLVTKTLALEMNVSPPHFPKFNGYLAALATLYPTVPLFAAWVAASQTKSPEQSAESASIALRNPRNME